MKRKLTTMFSPLMLAFACAAQSQVGPTDVLTITGPVAAVHIGVGMQYPTMTIQETQIKLAPIWYLLENSFEIKTGDVLSAVAAAGRRGDPYLYAITIKNAATGQEIGLRDCNGVPLWSKGQAREGPGSAGPCLNVNSAAVVTGAVEQIAMGAGIEMPTLVLKTADGKLLTLKLGPERVLLQADLELKAGDPVTVRYAVSSCSGELVAVEITDGSGKTVILRDVSGRPVWK